MTIKEYKDYLVDFLSKYIEDNNIKGFIFGVSGGVDSAVVAGLLKDTHKPVLGLIMPIESISTDAEDAIKVCQKFEIDYKIINLSKAFLEIKNNVTLSNDLAIANIKPRLRMTTLYALGQEYGYIVVGTDNACEYYTGYFTKFGDGAYDIMPLRFLVKSEVYEMAKILGVPESVINKKPSAGLIEGVTDESEMGLSYKDLDSYLLGKQVNQDVAKKIERLHARSNHKRNLAVLPKEYKR